MNVIRLGWKTALLSLSLLVATLASAQVTPPGQPPATGEQPSIPTGPPRVIGAIKDTMITPVASQTASTATASVDSLPDGHLDKAVTALNQGDKATSQQELQTGIASLEAEVQRQPTSFKDKLLGQVGKLKALLPLIAGGGVGGGALQKAVGLAKLASGGNRLEGLLSAGSLIGKASQLSGGLSTLGSAMSVLGGGQSAGKSLVTAALSSVSKLGQGGVVAQAAEPAVKSQIGNVLNFVKKSI